MGLSMLVFLALSAPMAEAASVSFQADDGARIVADEYGAGDTGVVLAHGGRFDKETWRRQARAMADTGLRVLAVNFRGYGESRMPATQTDRYENLHLDILAAARYLRESGAKRVHVVGASLGGWAAAEAAIADCTLIDRLVLLAPPAFSEPENVAGEKLVVFARNDPNAAGEPRLSAFRSVYERMPEPKSLHIVDGDAHAQHIFGTDAGEPLLEHIIAFLSRESGTTRCRGRAMTGSAG